MSNVVVGETLAPVTDPTTTTTSLPVTDDNGDSAVIVIRTTTLMTLLVISLIGNALVVLSVAQARSTRYVPFNAFVLSMASYCLLECALTMSLATGFSIEKRWNFGDFLAGFNASFIQLQNVGALLTIAVMSIDRYYSVTNVTKYHAQSSVHRANYVVLYTWIHAFIFSLPLLFQNQNLGITCRAFVERCLCGLVEGTSLVFTFLLLALCFILPTCVIIIFLIMMRVKVVKEKRRLQSLNNSEYSTYYLQESVILKEAEWSKYVTILFLFFLFFKSPYIIVDIMTQLNIPLAFESSSSDGSRFYYQTALAWMMFSFSALFPVLTFIQFPDHWRKMKAYITCSPITTSVAGGGPLTRSQRQLRQKQRRLRQRQKIAKRNARNKKRASVANASHILPTDKATSTMSPSITSEKITVNSSSAGGVLFRVPVLYPAGDGLHLVASEKALSLAFNDEPKKFKSGTASSSKPENPRDFPPNNKITQPSSDVVGDFRPSSVVDKRVDVTGSREGLHIDDDIAYINSNQCNSDLDETDSELNESINSNTLIWPLKRPRVVASASSVKIKSVWGNSHPEGGWKYEELRSPPNHRLGPHVELSEDTEDPPHPHTPSPPPDEGVLGSACTYKPVGNDTPSYNPPTTPQVSDSRPRDLLSRSYDGTVNPGYDQLSRDHSEVSIVPGRTKAFLSEEFSSRVVDSTATRTANSSQIGTHEPAHVSNTRSQNSTHRLIQVASRREVLSVAQHLGRYRHSSPLPDLIPDTR